MPVIAEGEVVGKRRTRSRAGWLLLAPITLVAILLLPVIGPVDFESEVHPMYPDTEHPTI